MCVVGAELYWLYYTLLHMYACLTAHQFNLNFPVYLLTLKNSSSGSFAPRDQKPTNSRTQSGESPVTSAGGSHGRAVYLKNAEEQVFPCSLTADISCNEV